MSGSSGSAPCPACGGTMDVSEDWKPFTCVSGQCLECGFTYYTESYMMSLAEVNANRKDCEMEPLKELKKADLKFIKNYTKGN